MKTVGEIIRSERIKKDLSLERLSSLTKIDIKYLENLEKDNYHLLPSETFIKGFIRNIAHRLDRDPEGLIAIFRRDYKQNEKKPISKSLTPTRKKLGLETTYLFPIIFGLIIFLGYLVFQFRVILTPPSLELLKPEQNSVIVSPFEVEGKTSVDAQVALGEDVKLRPDENGFFSAKLSLPIGETTLQVTATNRFGRSTNKKVFFTIVSK